MLRHAVHIHDYFDLNLKSLAQKLTEKISFS